MPTKIMVSHLLLIRMRLIQWLMTKKLDIGRRGKEDSKYNYIYERDRRIMRLRDMNNKRRDELKK